MMIGICLQTIRYYISFIQQSDIMTIFINNQQSDNDNVNDNS